MQFGIMEVQCDRLLPAKQSPADAMNHVENFNQGDPIRTLVAEIELTGDMSPFFPNAYKPVNVERLAEGQLNDAPDMIRTGQIGYNKDHLHLGTEDMAVKSLLSILSDQGFDGPLIFEHSITNAHKSMAYLRELGFAE